MIAKIVKFSGNVQGVGFRYTARSIAKQFSVTGYVMNLSDGQVEIYAEGELQEVDDFIRAIRAEMNNYITSCEIQSAIPSGRYKQFAVRFY